ncbi:MAG: hypothetical protein ACR2P8_02415 [Myxococcota bacterium]
MSAPSVPASDDHKNEPLAVTLKELLDVLGALTDSEDEVVATLLHMVEGGRVRLVAERAESF